MKKLFLKALVSSIMAAGVSVTFAIALVTMINYVNARPNDYVEMMLLGMIVSFITAFTVSYFILSSENLDNPI